VFRSLSSPGRSSSNSRLDNSNIRAAQNTRRSSADRPLASAWGGSTKRDPAANNHFVGNLFLFDRLATGCRFRFCPIRCAPFLAGLAPGRIERRSLRSPYAKRDSLRLTPPRRLKASGCGCWLRRCALLCVSGSFGDLAVKRLRGLQKRSNDTVPGLWSNIDELRWRSIAKWLFGCSAPTDLVAPRPANGGAPASTGVRSDKRDLESRFTSEVLYGIQGISVIRRCDTRRKRYHRGSEPRFVHNRFSRLLATSSSSPTA
jgi:hypothetical protein